MKPPPVAWGLWNGSAGFLTRIGIYKNETTAKAALKMRARSSNYAKNCLLAVPLYVDAEAVAEAMRKRSDGN